jgi:predicted DNA-binding transcriptional regulator AlpA
VTSQYFDRAAAEADPLMRPLTFEQVMRRTGRSRRTITAWIADGLLTPYLIPDGHRVIRVFVERQVLEVEKNRRQAAAASKLNLAASRRRAAAAR